MGDRAKIQERSIDEPEGMRRGGSSACLPTVEESLRVQDGEVSEAF